jgi:hypothetical protein
MFYVSKISRFARAAARDRVSCIRVTVEKSALLSDELLMDAVSTEGRTRGRKPPVMPLWISYSGK